MTHRKARTLGSGAQQAKAELCCVELEEVAVALGPPYRRGSGLVMPAGSIAVINPGVVHTGRAATGQGWTYRIYPNPGVLQRAAAHLVGRDQGVPFFATPVIHDPTLAAHLLQLHRTLEDTTTTRLERDLMPSIGSGPRNG